jgi:hypothetical protein
MKKLILFLTFSIITLHNSFAQSDTLASAKQKQKIANASEYIKKESLGGSLDFRRVLEKDEHALFLFENFAYSKKDFAIFLWGKNVKDLGLTSSKKAVKLWQEIYTRQLTSPEERALVRGFDTTSKK